MTLALLLRSSHLAGATARASRSSLSQPAARLSQHISVQAAGRGNPWINLSDGGELQPEYVGPEWIAQALEENQAQPLALASGDFDEDGVPDLITGCAIEDRGIVILHHGNADSIYPNSPEAQLHRAEAHSAMSQQLGSDDAFSSTPFLETAAVFELPEPPAFIGAGDFDGDGHWDVVAAARAARAVYFLSGDGKGGLNRAERIELPGPVTALAVGDVNRRDGMADIIIGVAGPAGAQVLAFEGSDGALKARPEAISAPAEVTALAIGQFDDDYPIDMALGTGSEVLIVHGRDRQTYFPESVQRNVPPPVVERLPVPFKIASIAAGSFTSSQRTDLAVLSATGEVHVFSRNEDGKFAGAQKAQSPNHLAWREALTGSVPGAATERASQLLSVRTSSLTTDDLLVFGSEGLHILATEPNGGDGQQSLAPSRRPHVTASFDMEGEPVAVLPMRLNPDALNDLVILRKGRSTPSVLLTQAGMTFIVTNTNDSGPGSLRQAIIDANNTPGADTIRFQIGSGVQTITPSLPLPEINDPVTIDGTTQPGFSGTPIIELNGSSIPVSVCGGGLLITGGNSVVRGLVINRCACQAIALYGPGNNNIVEGNFLGTDVTGTVGLGSFDHLFVGVEVSLTNRPVSSDNLIGGTVPAARNIIGQGLHITGQPFFNQTSSGNVVLGNFIGTDVTGTASLNIGSGVKIINLAMNNTVGGLTAGASNVISGSSLSGIDLGAVSFSMSKANLIQKNLIGTAINGVDLIGNGMEGILATGQDNTIDRNVIAFSGSEGVRVLPGSRGCRITLNRIYSNGTFRRGLGIRLEPGANNNQPAPSLSSATLGEVLATVEGSIVAAPSTTYRIEFFGNDECDLSGFGEGQTPLGSTDVTTLGSGLGVFSARVFHPLPGQTVITATATDPAGDTSEFSQCIQINHAPVALCRNVTKSADSNCQATVTPQEIGNGSSDPDGDPITLSISPSGPFSLGTTNVTLTVTDSNGASSACTATVTVVDTTPPAVRCPADLTVANDPGQCSAVVQSLGAPAVTDNCTVNIIPVSSRSDGRPLTDPYPVGVTTITWTATDAANNSARCQQTVIVRDTEKPTLTCPSNVTQNGDSGQCSAVVNYLVSATDNCSGVVVVSTPPSGSVFPVGVTTVTSTATDASGNTATCTFTVTIIDRQAPIISGVSASPSVLWPPNHKMVPVTIDYDVSDNCGRRSAITCALSVTSDEPVDGDGDGDTAPDWEIADSHHVRLRAERAGSGSGRIYTITITCTDAGGNSSLRMVTVSVPHDQS